MRKLELVRKSSFLKITAKLSEEPDDSNHLNHYHMRRKHGEHVKKAF